MRKLTFARVFCSWFFLAVILLFINIHTLQSSFLAGLIQSTLGFFLLFVPVYPEQLGWRYDEIFCRRFIRILAVIQIILSFASHIHYY